jgi:hypothetical protein
VGDVGERARVDEAGRALGRLHEGRLDRLAQDDRGGAGAARVVGGDRGAVLAVAEDDAADALAHVHDAVGQREDRHELARDGDVEAGAPRDAVLVAAEADEDVAHHAVVDVHDAAPRDAVGVEAEAVLQQDRGVDVRGDEVVGRRHGVDVARQVEVELLHRDDLAVAAAGGAALDAEERAHGGLAEAREDLLAELGEARPIVWTVLPSPSGVGVTAVTTT